MGWEVVTIKYGHLLEAAFREPGGEALRAWIDSCPNQLYLALTFQGGAAWRKRLRDDLGDQGAVSALIARRSDDELGRLKPNPKERASGRERVRLYEHVSGVPVPLIKQNTKK